MQRSQRLQVVLDLADKAVQNAAQVLETARQQLGSEEKKLTDLQHYYQEYSKLFDSQSQGVRALDVARQRTFLSQLQQAQQHQQQVIAQRRQLVATKQKLWHLAYLKQRAIAELITRLKKDENLALSRKEEKRLDEWSQQASRRKASATAGQDAQHPS